VGALYPRPRLNYCTVFYRHRGALETRPYRAGSDVVDIVWR
jgi:hypothetical protein